MLKDQTPTPTASVAYAMNYNEVHDLIDRLKQDIADDTVDCQQANWAQVGDLIRIRDLLRQTIRTTPEEAEDWGL